jgi:hypothetical protein
VARVGGHASRSRQLEIGIGLALATDAGAFVNLKVSSPAYAVPLLAGGPLRRLNGGVRNDS